MQNKKKEMWVGVFMIMALSAILFVCLKVTDIRLVNKVSTYPISAIFDNIGGLKLRAPVKIGGVVIGRVTEITLDPKTYEPTVSMDIDETYNHIPNTSSLAIRSSGLFGEQYLALTVGFEDPEMGSSILKGGSMIQDTKSAIVLEDLIGQFLYKSGIIVTPDAWNNANDFGADDNMPTVGTSSTCCGSVFVQSSLG